MSEPTVAVAEPPDTDASDAILTAIDAVGAKLVRGPAEELRGHSNAVCTVVTSRRDLATLGPEMAVLPVGLPGIDSVAPTSEAIEAALHAVFTDAIGKQRRWLLLVRRSRESPALAALSEVVLQSTTPGHLAAFEVVSEATGSTGQFRADGLVVATPAGSDGYAGAVGVPSMAPQTGIAVAPIAQFAVDRNQWVLPAAPIECRIHREQPTMVLRADGADEHRCRATDLRPRRVTDFTEVQGECHGA